MVLEEYHDNRGDIDIRLAELIHGHRDMPSRIKRFNHKYEEDIRKYALHSSDMPFAHEKLNRTSAALALATVESPIAGVDYHPVYKYMHESDAGLITVGALHRAEQKLFTADYITTLSFTDDVISLGPVNFTVVVVADGATPLIQKERIPEKITIISSFSSGYRPDVRWRCDFGKIVSPTSAKQIPNPQEIDTETNLVTANQADPGFVDKAKNILRTELYNSLMRTDHVRGIGKHEAPRYNAAEIARNLLVDLNGRMVDHYKRIYPFDSSSYQYFPSGIASILIFTRPISPEGMAKALDRGLITENLDGFAYTGDITISSRNTSNEFFHTNNEPDLVDMRDVFATIMGKKFLSSNAYKDLISAIVGQPYNEISADMRERLKQLAAMQEAYSRPPFLGNFPEPDDLAQIWLQFAVKTGTFTYDAYSQSPSVVVYTDGAKSKYPKVHHITRPWEEQVKYDRDRDIDRSMNLTPWEREEPSRIDWDATMLANHPFLFVLDQRLQYLMGGYEAQRNFFTPYGRGDDIGWVHIGFDGSKSQSLLQSMQTLF